MAVVQDGGNATGPRAKDGWIGVTKIRIQAGLLPMGGCVSKNGGLQSTRIVTTYITQSSFPREGKVAAVDRRWP